MLPKYSSKISKNLSTFSEVTFFFSNGVMLSFLKALSAKEAHSFPK